MTASRAERAEPLEIGGRLVPPGERLRFDLPGTLLPTHTQLDLPLAVCNGLKPGPRLWLSAAVHGDELNGLEVIRRVLDALPYSLARGVLIAAPIVNVLGFLQQSRYLPDRRDLNRSFPGSKRGSLASRIAHLFLSEVVMRCTHGIDLHTASLEKTNWPQVRGNLEHPETRRMAEAFAAPVMVHSVTRNGSLRAAANELGIPVLVYEAGEPLRFNPDAIEIGVQGVVNVLRELGMVSRGRVRRRRSILVEESQWVRARHGGLLRLAVAEGERVEPQQVLGVVGGPFGDERVVLRAPFRGIVIGRSNNPVVHGGDAVVHLGRLAGEDPAPAPGARSSQE